MNRQKRMGLPIEEHAEEVYTRAMHDRFYSELYESGSYILQSKSTCNQRFTVVHNKEKDNPEAKTYSVILEGEFSISCSCGLYEHSGLLCRHSLKVTNASNYC